MTTALSKPLAREIEYDGRPYKVVVSAEGIRFTAKGARRGITLSWGDVLGFDDGPGRDAEGSAPTETPSARDAHTRKLGMQDVVAAVFFF